MNWVKPDKTNNKKGTFFTSSGKTIVVVTRIKRLPGINKKEYPDDRKFSLMAFDKINKKEYVRLDNHHNKPPHWHDNEKQGFFEWVSVKETKKLFRQKLREKFGEIIYRVK